jgi:predicted transcriptional regulator
MTGQQLQAFLHSKSLRHKDVARLLNLTERTVSRYVAAKRVPRVVEYALRFAIGEQRKPRETSRHG